MSGRGRERIPVAFEAERRERKVMEFALYGRMRESVA